MQVTGIVSRPPETRTMNRREGGGTFTVHELQLLDDTAGVLMLQTFEATSPFPATLKRGHRITAAVRRVAVFNGAIQCDIEGGVSPAPADAPAGGRSA